MKMEGHETDSPLKDITGFVDLFEPYNVTNTTIRAEHYSEPDSLNLIIPITVIYSIIFVAGIIGNVSTCLVIARNRSMHTATNFYLFSLAISDLILLVCGLPIETHRLWRPQTYPLGEAACIALGLASETSANATVLTITAFTVERYIAICRPFMSHTMSKLSRAVRYIFAIWVMALCTAVPQAMQFGIEENNDEEGNSTLCTVKGHGVHQVFVISSFIFFVVPMTVITVLYALIGVKLRTSRVLQPKKKTSIESNGRTVQNSRYRNGASQRRVIRMLVVVALSFFVCWAPFHVQRLVAIYGKSVESPSNTFLMVYVVLTYLSGVSYFLSTAINPILYNIMSNKFRDAFKKTLAAWCGRSSSHTGRRYSTFAASQRGPRTLPNGLGSVRPRRLRRRSTATTQLCDGARAQQIVVNRELPAFKLPAFRESREGSAWVPRRIARLTSPRGSDSAESPRSISNSSLREMEDEFTGEELATYMLQVNRNIGAGGQPI